MKKIICYTILLFLAPTLYSQSQLLKSVGRVSATQTTKTGLSILETLETRWMSASRQAELYKMQEKATLAAKQRAVRLEKFQPVFPSDDRYTIIRTPILPTPSFQLPKLSHPFIGQEYEFSRQYEELMKDFLSFKTNFNGQAFYRRASNRMPMEERRRWLDQLIPIRRKMLFLQRTVYPEDKPLQAAINYLNFAMGEINPMLKEYSTPLLERVARRFQREEFIFDEAWFYNIQRMAWPAREAVLPQKAKIAVINDDPTVLNAYTQWQKEGAFGEWEIELYSEPETIINQLIKGKKVDLIISDWMIENHSVVATINRLRVDGNTTPVIVCSSHSTEEIDANRMFNQGFDGFVSWRDVSTGGVDFLKDALKRFFYYKEYYKW